MASKKSKVDSSKKINKKANGAMPVPKLSKPRDLTAEALKRLKVKPEQLSSVPQITQLFKKAEGGLRGCIEAMRFAVQDETIAAFLKKYDSLSEDDRRRVPWEAVAIAAELDMRQLAGAIMIALSEASASTVRIIALTSHPKIMESTVKYAQMASGEKDRSIIHLAQGYLPSPKPPAFIGKAFFGMPNNQPQLGSGAPETIDAVTVDDGDDIEDRLFTHVNLDSKLTKIRQKELKL